MTDPIPCRICGMTRDAHDGRFLMDHRYRAERYCVADGKVATWYVNGTAVCSAHKGAMTRAVADDAIDHMRLERIDNGRL